MQIRDTANPSTVQDAGRDAGRDLDYALQVAPLDLGLGSRHFVSHDRQKRRFVYHEKHNACRRGRCVGGVGALTLVV
jgi:hypothetical protein